MSTKSAPEPPVREDGPDLELRLNGAEDLSEVAGAAVRSMAGAAGLAADRLTRLRVVVEELVREARARERVGQGDDVVVRVYREPGRLSVEVVDLAMPVSPADTAHAQSRRLASLGFVDELEIAARGRAGNASTASVALGSSDEAGDLGVEVLDRDAPAALDADELEIRRMEPEDALGLARCIYRCYGYSYKTALLYEPGQVAEAIRAELMRSVVAVNSAGEVVGHCALFVEREGDRIPEAGRMVVDPRYRGHHLGDRMAQVRLGIARAAGRAGFWAEAVTNHPGSQKEVIRAGGAEVGLLIGASPAEVAMTGIENTNEGRRTLLAVYTPLVREPQVIHVPEQHAEFVALLADRLDLEREILSSPEPSPEPSELVTRVQPEIGVAHVIVARVGHDIAPRVAAELDGLDAFDLSAVHLDLPLARPASCDASGLLEQLGFCLAAWLPDFSADGSDVLRLQRVGDHPVDVAHIVCARPEGEQIRDHVVADWRRVRRGGIA